MRLLIVALVPAMLICTAPIGARSPATLDSVVFVERATPAGGFAVDRLARDTPLSRGDRVVTVLRWTASGPNGRKATSAVPRGLAVESASRDGLEISSDNGRTWRLLPDGDAVPAGVTHLRWSLDPAGGSFTYRAVVR